MATAAVGDETSLLVEPVLRATGLRKSFRGQPAVDGVDLSVAAGERVAVLGPNGAGKTTTLLMLLGAVSADGGTIEVLGHRYPHGHAAAMEHVGFAAGYLPLPARLTVLEVLTTFGRLHGRPDPEADARAGLERFGITHLVRAMAAELSSGQRTLVGIVKATMHHPRLIVLDEPTASLDPDVAWRVRTALEEIVSDTDTALLFTSHDMIEVERLSQRVMFMSGGKVVANGPAEAVMAQFGHASLEEVFLRLAAEARQRPPERRVS